MFEVFSDWLLVKMHQKAQPSEGIYENDSMPFALSSIDLHLAYSAYVASSTTDAESHQQPQIMSNLPPCDCLRAGQPGYR